MQMQSTDCRQTSGLTPEPPHDETERGERRGVLTGDRVDDNRIRNSD